MHTHLIFWRNCIVVTDVRRDARSLQIEHAPRLTYVPECHQTHVLKDSSGCGRVQAHYLDDGRRRGKLAKIAARGHRLQEVHS